MTGRQWRAESDRGQLRAGVKLRRPTVFLSVLQAVTGGQYMAGSDRGQWRSYSDKWIVEGRF